MSVQVALRSGRHTVVDTADVAVVANHLWHFNNGYAARWECKRRVYLHRELMGLVVGDGQEVDHINRDKLDNRRANLRIVTRGENQQNISSIRGSSSAYRGVSRVERPSGIRWRAYAQVDGKKFWLGHFASEEAAARTAAEFRAERMPFSSADRRGLESLVDWSKRAAFRDEPESPGLRSAA